MNIYKQEEIFGHQDIISYFSSLQRKKRIAHAYLFVGKQGIGKHKVAKFIAMMLNCSSADMPCLQCDNCYRIKKDIHPDVHMVKPDKSVGIKEIRDIRKKVYIKKFLSKYRVVIIDDADKLTADAANAFLKTLEEPPQNTVFFLITDKPQNLFPTIRSRVHKLWFSLKIDQARQYLSAKGIDKTTADIILQISENNLELAEKLLSKRFSSKRLAMFADQAALFNITEHKRKDLKETVYLLLTFLRDCLVLKNSPEAVIINKDLTKTIISYQDNLSAKSIASKMNSLLTLNQVLDNININLANNIIQGTLRK